MYVVFQSVFAWTVPAMEVIESLVGRVGEGISAYLPRALCNRCWSTALSPASAAC